MNIKGTLFQQVDNSRRDLSWC